MKYPSFRSHTDMHIKGFWGAALLAGVLSTTPWTQAQTVQLNCTSTLEYVTSLEYLRKQDLIEVPEDEARRIAYQVSKGCIGAGSRFIRVTQTLSKAGLSSKDTLTEAIALANRPDSEAETFITVFQKAFLKEYLDLDLRSSLTLARSLSREFKGDVLAVRNDFEDLVEFCAKEEGLDLPKPQCAEHAARIARAGEKFSGGIAHDFVSVFRFLASDSKGPKITTAAAFNQAEDLIKAGPGAAQNFIQGFKYAVSRKGLSLPVEKAFDFGKIMALQTNPVVSNKP